MYYENIRSLLCILDSCNKASRLYETSPKRRQSDSKSTTLCRRFFYQCNPDLICCYWAPRRVLSSSPILGNALLSRSMCERADILYHVERCDASTFYRDRGRQFVEPYLGRAFDRHPAQTYRKFEIICVDDGSPVHPLRAERVPEPRLAEVLRLRRARVYGCGCGRAPLFQALRGQDQKKENRGLIRRRLPVSSQAPASHSLGLI